MKQTKTNHFSILVILFWDRVAHMDVPLCMVDDLVFVLALVFMCLQYI